MIAPNSRTMALGSVLCPPLLHSASSMNQEEFIRRAASYKVPRIGQLRQQNFIFPQSWSLEVQDQTQLVFPEVSLLGLWMSCFLVSSSLHIVFHGLLLGMSVSLSPLLIRTPVSVV